MVEINFEFDAFNFDGICRTVQLTLCPLIGKEQGIVPVCYSRNVELADNLIFQPGTEISFSFLFSDGPSLLTRMSCCSHTDYRRGCDHHGRIYDLPH